MKLKLLSFYLIFCSVTFGQGKFSGGNGDGFASASLINVVLPLKVISFNAVEKNNIVQACIRIESTEPICNIVLERSINAVNYRPADSMSASLPGLTGNSFCLNDRQQLDNTTWYRAKISTCNSGITYSGTVALKSKENGIRLYYSPGNINYSVPVDGKLQVINPVGQLIKETTLQKGSGAIPLPLPGNALYLFRFLGEEGKTYSKKISCF